MWFFVLKITLLCNAGLMLDNGTDVLLVDVPNRQCPPFYCLPEETWKQILLQEKPYERICGLCFTHNHPDHCFMGAVRKLLALRDELPVFLPEKHGEAGTINMNGFEISYGRIPHAPLDGNEPIHTVLLIRAGEKTVYITGDANADASLHRGFLQNKKVDAAFWISTYLSKSETRTLLQDISEKNFIYHMPEKQTDKTEKIK